MDRFEEHLAECELGRLARTDRGLRRLFGATAEQRAERVYRREGLLLYEIMHRGARGGSLAVVKWVQARGRAVGSSIYAIAVRNRDVEMLEWINAQRDEASQRTADSNLVWSVILSEEPSIALFEWLESTGHDYSSGMAVAVRKGTPELAAWLEARMGRFPKSTFRGMGASPNTDITKWAVMRGYDTGSTLENACAVGNFELVRWLREERGFEWTDSCAGNAVRNGNAEMLLWMRREGCPYDVESVRANVCGCNSVEMLDLLWSEGWRPREADLRCAATMAHVPVLDWYFRKLGNWFLKLICSFRFNERCAVEGYVWMIEKGMCSESLFKEAFSCGSVKLIRMMRLLGHEWPSEGACENAARCCEYRLVRYALENGCPVQGTELATLLSSNGDLQTLKQAHRRRVPMDLDTCVRTAASQGHYHVVRWIVGDLGHPLSLENWDNLPKSYCDQADVRCRATTRAFVAEKEKERAR